MSAKRKIKEQYGNAKLRKTTYFLLKDVWRGCEKYESEDNRTLKSKKTFDV